MWKWLARVLLAVMLIAILTLGYCVYRGISNSLHAEHVYHAALLTIQLLDEYVTRNDGDWPDSWADLENTPHQGGGMYEWPTDSQEVQQYVSVDFSADVERLLRLEEGEFDAVRPIGPYYPFQDHPRVEVLLGTIRKHSED
jgi:hypothetical protein